MVPWIWQGAYRSKLEFPKSKVFHSFRNTVATKLESAGIPENIATK